MEEVQSMSSLPSNEFLDPIFDKEDLIEDFKVIYVISYFFVSFEVSGGSYNLSQNTLGRIREMYPIFHGKLNCRFYPIFYCCCQIFTSAGEIGH